jgi:hypothetical protein
MTRTKITYICFLIEKLMHQRWQAAEEVVGCGGLPFLDSKWGKRESYTNTARLGKHSNAIL